MGLASLGVLESVVRGTIGLRWEEIGEMSDVLTLVDTDISQARIQVDEPREFFNDVLTSSPPLSEL